MSAAPEEPAGPGEGDDRAEPSRATAGERALALVSLGSTALLVGLVIAFLVTNIGYVVLGLAGLGLAVAGAWWLIAERPPRRTVGLVGAMIGAAAVLVALALAPEGGGTTAWRVAVVLALLALAVGTARAAIVESVRPAAPTPAPPPSRPVLLCNPWSGGGKVARFHLVDLASSLGVETVLLDHGLDLEVLARDAVARGADCLGMAGGDGSQALVASIAVAQGLPFVCVSAGTRNHFAFDLGLTRDDPRPGVRAFADGEERWVDYATVNDRFFVNNVSLGVYATLVQQEGYREAKSETTRRLLPELLAQASEPFDLQFTTPDGTEVDGPFLLMVSNNPYILGLSPDLSQRRRLDTGQLGVFAVTARTGAEVSQVVTLALAGKAARSGRAYQFTTPTFEVRSRSGTAYAGVDGEALELPTPMRFEIHPGGLHLRVPRGNLEAAARRRARDLHLGDLLSIAAGRRIP